MLNVCELAERGPVVLAFFAEPIGRCVEQIDVLDRLRSRFPDVQFAAVAIRGDRGDLRERGARARLAAAVGHDENGAVANAYAVAVCPQITFAARGGEVQDDLRLAGRGRARRAGSRSCERRAGHPARPRGAGRRRRAPGPVAGVDRGRGHSGPTPRELRERLRGWPTACTAPRRSPCGSARCRTPHRVFFRHIGLDPDVVRTPVEALVLRRMSEGGLRPQGLIADALNVAVLGDRRRRVGVRRAALVGAPRIEELEGRLVLADEAGAGGAVRRPSPRGGGQEATHRIALVAVAVPGVADLFVHEALWTAWDIPRRYPVGDALRRACCRPMRRALSWRSSWRWRRARGDP